MYYTILKHRKKNPRLFLLVDFEKAFDFVDHSFIKNALGMFKFWTDLLWWVNVFYKDAESCLVVNGRVSRRFSIERGCRQGDILSHYVFLMCTEIIGISIRKEGIAIVNITFFFPLFADYMSLFHDSSKEFFESTVCAVMLPCWDTKFPYFTPDVYMKVQILVTEALFWQDTTSSPQPTLLLKLNIFLQESNLAYDILLCVTVVNHELWIGESIADRASVFFQYK